MVEDQAQFVSLQIVEFLVANKLVELFWASACGSRSSISIPAKKDVDKGAMSFLGARLSIVSLGRREGAMAEQRRGKAHVRWIGDRHCRCRSVAKQVRIDRDPELLLRPSADAVVNRHLRHRRAILGDPERALDRTGPTTGPCHQDGPVMFEVRFERSPQDIGQPDLERGVGLGVILAEGDDPGRPFADECPFEDEIGEIAPAQRDQREKRRSGGRRDG